MSIRRCYHVKHLRDFSKELEKARQVAEYAVANKFDPKVRSTSSVKNIQLHSAIKNQILKKYSKGNIKKATNVNLIVPTQPQKRTLKNGTIKWYKNIDYKNGIVFIKPLKTSFRWNPGRTIIKIDQIEINECKFMISVTLPDEKVNQEYTNILGIDLNCGRGRWIVNSANLRTGELFNLGKKGTNIRQYYRKKRQEHNKKGKGYKMKGNKEKRIMKDLDHKMSRKIVDYAFQNQLKIVVEKLTNIRESCRKGMKARPVNGMINSWSFYRLQSYIEYKAQELGVPFEKVNPHYTSKHCSYCTVEGYRDGDTFICNNKNCKVYKKIRHADINAAFNVGKRSLQAGGKAK